MPAASVASRCRLSVSIGGLRIWWKWDNPASKSTDGFIMQDISHFLAQRLDRLAGT
jgi:hypothetical protein